MLENYKESSLSIADSIFRLLKDCEEIRYEVVLGDTENDENKVNKISARIQQDVFDSLQNVIHKIKLLYGVELKDIDFDGKIDEDETVIKSTLSKKVDQVSGGATIGGFIGSMGVLKGIAAGATVAGMLPIVIVGAAIGGIWALFAKGEKDTTKKEFYLKQEDLIKVLEKAITILWVSSNKGYGVGKADDSELVELVNDKCKLLVKGIGIDSVSTNDPVLKDKIEQLVLKITFS
jgi:hypothetical protein